MIMTTTSSPDHIETVHAETGKFWAEDVGADLLRVVEFAGNFVPDGGLVLNPPSGGELVVWPDGQYEFTYPSDDGGSQYLIATYFSYVVEASDGTTSVGAFALGEHLAAPEAMEDFQAWSMDDIIALDETVGLGLDMADSIADIHGLQGDIHTEAWNSAVFDAAEPNGAIDTLDYMINTTYDT
jgi:hypothetical protein